MSITKRELHNAVNSEMVIAANRVINLKKELKYIQKDIEYWAEQERAARTLSIRLDKESDEN